MALRGTLKDFGIADIFQLIGHQQKTGILTVSDRSLRTEIYFSNGNIVRAESHARNEKDMLGRMLVRAELITEAHLKESLDIQKKTLRRLGEILIGMGVIDRAELQSFIVLQTQETIYRLFVWDSGNYEFAQAEVEVSDGDPIRSENVLMEGFRQVDEWPRIRKAISGYGMKYSVLEDLETVLAAAPAEEEEEEDDFGFGDLGDSSSSKDPRLKNIGENERRVFALVNGSRDVQKLIDLARLGEFETCKSLVNLADAGFLKASKGKDGRAHEVMGGALSGASGGRASLPGFMGVVLRTAMAFGAIVVVVSGVFLLQKQLTASRSNNVGFRDHGVKHYVSRRVEYKIERAIEAYRVLHDTLPESLDALVEAKLLRETDVFGPWAGGYVYRRHGSEYTLLPPFR